VELTGADLSFPEGGNVQLEGSFPDIAESTLAGRWEKVPIATVLPQLKQQIVGTLEGTAKIRWNQAGAQSIDGTLKAHDVIVSNIHLLDEVSSLTGMDAFHHLLLQQAQGTFSIKDGNFSWHDVVLESQGLIKLVGDASYKPNGSLSGAFQLGLSSPIVKVIPGAAQVFSKDQHDGYYWTSLRVGGSLSHPTEDLTPRITTAILTNAGLLLQQGVKQGLKILGVSGGNPATSTTPPPARTNSPIGTMAPSDDLKRDGGAVTDTNSGLSK
jgi:hypothetical protein